jgi:N utilization substance protein B
MRTGTRRQARERALQALYAMEIGRRDAGDAIAEVTAGDTAPKQRLFVNTLVYGVLEHRDELDAVIAPRLEGWTMDRLSTIDRAILRMAVYELLYMPETPPAVVASEAVALAKRYSADNAAAFVNGVLGGLVRERAAG